ncbi:MAG: DUF1501 domain-containing protein [Acidobacteriota bacterium]
MPSHREICDACRLGGSFPVHGEGFSRRRFFRIAGTAIVGSYFADVLNPPRLEAASAPPLKGTARNCILVFMAGAPSHSDTWDLKEGAWTPAAFAPTSFGDIRFAQGLMPNIATHLDKCVFVRSVLSWAAVHGLAQTWVQKSRNPTGVLGDVSPHIGSVVSLESQAQRKPGDILPGFVGFGTSSMIGSGYMSSRYAPLVVPSVSAGGLPSVKPANPALFAERYSLLQTLDTDRAAGAPYGDVPADMADFYAQAKALADSPTINTIFGYTAADYARYGSTQFGGAALIAKQVLAANQGTRFVQLTSGGWDNHANIYAANAGLFNQMKFFDPAVGALMGDLAAIPGVAAGKTLLDETLVVMIGEFGRTVGPVNAQGGRDHFQRMSVAFAGGGVKGGRAVGVTDATANKVVDYGWSGNRDVRIEDLTTTIYSALGIDYTTVLHNDPVGRGYEYVPFAKDGVYFPVNEVF